MTECRYYCPENMIRLSSTLRQINKATVENKALQNKINQLIEKLNAHGHASNVAHVLLQDILGASKERLVPLLRCVVKSLTKLRGNVFTYFEFWLPDSIEDIFEYLCTKNDTRTKRDLWSLQKEWRTIFSLETLNDIDQRLHRLDPKWPICEITQTPSLPEQIDATTAPTIHEMNSSSLEGSKSSSSVRQTAMTTESKVEKSDSLELSRKYESSAEPLRTKSSQTATTKSKLNSEEKCNKFSAPQSQTTELHKMMFARRSITKRQRLSSIGSSSNSDRENDADFPEFLVF